jgi:glyoxylase-like metal-dependent hydrolase (beta-lactamase superfamily II)
MESEAPLRRSPVRERPEIHQIVLPTPWPVGPVQVYLVEAEPLTLVDTGVRSPGSWAALGLALDGLGYGVEDLRRVVLTHYHGDHLGQAESLRRAGADIEVWCHALEAPWCEGFSAERDENIEGTEALFREYGVPEDLLARQTSQRREWVKQDPLCEATHVDRVLRESERVSFKDFSLEVIHAPGHTAGHLLLHEPASGVLLTGDHIMGNAVPFTENYYLEDAEADPGDRLHRRPRFKGLPRYMQSLRTLRGRPFRTILPAHGGVIERPGRAIEDAILFYEVRIQRIERALRKIAGRGRAVTAWEIWQHLFPKADPVTEMRTRMTMVIGALDGLEETGAVRVARRADGILVFLPGPAGAGDRPEPVPDRPGGARR